MDNAHRLYWSFNQIRWMIHMVYLLVQIKHTLNMTHSDFLAEMRQLSKPGLAFQW